MNGTRITADIADFKMDFNFEGVQKESRTQITQTNANHHKL